MNISINSFKDKIRSLHPRNFKAWQLKKEEEGFNHCHVISTQPSIIYLWWGRDDSVWQDTLRDQRVILLYLFPWLTRDEDIIPIAESVKARLKRFPRHRIVLLCNEQHTVEPFCCQGVEAVFCNQNAFINENIFGIESGVEKKYSAVYNASMASYKRHALASGINPLMIMTYRYKGTHRQEYEASVRQALAHADWVKDSYSDDDKGSTEQIIKFYNACKVGLCLSEYEGSMFVSMEYLLCGLPIVSTPCLGGRDTFWDNEYVIVAEPNVEAIAEAVATLNARNIDPQLVRSKTLQKVEPHRDCLRKLLAREMDHPLEIPWQPGSHGISTWTNLRTLAKRLKS